MYVCTTALTNTYTHIYMYIHHTNNTHSVNYSVNIHMNMYIHTHIHMYIHTSNKHIHTSNKHIYTYIHAYICVTYSLTDVYGQPRVSNAHLHQHTSECLLKAYLTAPSILALGLTTYTHSVNYSEYIHTYTYNIYTYTILTYTHAHILTHTYIHF